MFVDVKCDSLSLYCNGRNEKNQGGIRDFPRFFHVFLIKRLRSRAGSGEKDGAVLKAADGQVRAVEEAECRREVAFRERNGAGIEERDAFWQGAARGLGMMVGFAVLGAAVLYFLQDLAQRNLPLIGDFVAQVVTLVRLRLQ